MDSSNPSPSLAALGWDEFFQQHFAALAIPGAVPARVAAEFRDSYQVVGAQGELVARLAGRMRYQTEALRPAVGDWVALAPPGTILAVLPRKSSFTRKEAGRRTAAQVVAANVDTVFVVSGLDGGRSLSLRRLERYLTLAWNSGAAPVLVLNKADLCSEVSAYTQEVEAIAPGVPVHAVSAKEGLGLEGLRGYLQPGQTVAFLGSSGVGKSALINALLGEARQATGAVRADDHEGRHTTTRRELILLPGGGMVIDTPGMRELQLWAGEDDLAGAFTDVAALSANCRFRDCTHQGEPGCAVREAAQTGALDAARLESFHKLQGELTFLAERAELGARRQEKARWKHIAQQIKDLKKHAG